MPSVTDHFTLASDFELRGDQVHAVPELVEGLNRGDKHQVLLGVTGSGKTYTMAQVEYRTTLFWRFGFTAFAGVGDVADSYGKYQLSDMKPSVGFGLRFLFDPKERINIRADFGFGRNTSGVYFAIEEAF